MAEHVGAGEEMIDGVGNEKSGVGKMNASKRSLLGQDRVG